MGGYRIWNLAGLKEDLRANRLSEHENFRYFFAYSLFNGGLAGKVFLSKHPDFSLTVQLLFMTVSTLTFLATLIGPFYCYRKNRGASGDNFLGKFFPLWFVCSIRLVILFCIAGLLLIFGFPSDTQRLEAKIIVDSFFALIFVITQYYFIGKSIEDIQAT